MAIPTLSPEQLQAAREAATQARRARAELKEKVRSGSLSLGQPAWHFQATAEVDSRRQCGTRLLLLADLGIQPAETVTAVC